MTTVTGVSAIWKINSVNEILFKALSNHFYSSKDKPGEHDKITGLQNLDKVIGIDQSPIGRTPRSNTATYVNAFGPIREIFSKHSRPEKWGINQVDFHLMFQVAAVIHVRGAGVKRIEMQFLADVYVTCDECKGKRYNSETLQITYKGKTISDILDMTVEEALDFFSKYISMERKLMTLYDCRLRIYKIRTAGHNTFRRRSPANKVIFRGSQEGTLEVRYSIPMNQLRITFCRRKKTTSCFRQTCK